jgi:hypothetical protein
MNKPLTVYFLLAFYAVFGACGILFFDGTGDVGDSITHYLFAKSAPFHPELYFDHWAKPLYVLMASPFAQFGFSGIKVFNLLNTLITLYLIYKSALALNLKNSWIALLLAMFSPLYYVLTLSGLTEPLFALFVALGLYFSLNKRHLAAAVCISFLPYVRSEGLLILGVYLMYFVSIKHWKVIPFLLFGSFVYGVAGYFAHGSFFWVFSKIPYATLSSVYGSGDLMNFVYQLYYVVGAPVYILLGIGLVYVFRNFFSSGLAHEVRMLVFLGFGAFFIAHTLFWYLGIFNSMGLKRVLLGVMPYIAILGLYGFNFLQDNFFSKIPYFTKAFTFVLIVYVVVFPVLPNPAAIDVKRDLMLSKEQEMAIQISDKLRGFKFSSPIFYNHYYLSLVLNLDHFDPLIHRELDSNLIRQSPSGTKIIWENMYAEKKSGLSKNDLDQHLGLTKLYECSGEVHQKEMVWALYERK